MIYPSEENPILKEQVCGKDCIKFITIITLRFTGCLLRKSALSHLPPRMMKMFLRTFQLHIPVKAKSHLPLPVKAKALQRSLRNKNLDS